MKSKEPSVFLQEVRLDLDTFKRLSGKKKIGFIWDYYKWYILALVFAIVTICTFAHMIWEGQKPCRLRVCVVLNTEDNCRLWFDQFIEELTSDGKPGAVDVNLDQPFDYDNQYYYVQEIEVMTTVSSLRMDVAVCGPDMYSYLLALNACMPLERGISKELFSTLEKEGRLVYDTANLTVDENGHVNPADGIDGYYAVNLKGTEFEEKYNQNEEKEDLYAVIIANTEHLKDCETLVRELVEK